MSRFLCLFLIPGCFVLVFAVGSAAGQDLYRLGAGVQEPSFAVVEEVVLAGIDPAALTAKTELVALPLPGGESYRAVAEGLEIRAPGRFTWRGRLLVPGSTPGSVDVTLTVEDGLVPGLISALSGTYLIQPRVGGLHTVARLDGDGFPDGGGG